MLSGSLVLVIAGTLYIISTVEGESVSNQLSTFGVSAANIADVIALACRRNSKLKLCDDEVGYKDTLPDHPRQHPVNKNASIHEHRPIVKPSYRSHTNISWIQEHYLRTLAAQTLKFKNPFDDDENVLLDDDLV